jgi:uncharacterized protein DUF6455
MKTETHCGSNESLWRWLAGWWQARARRHAAVSEVDHLDPAVASGISRDLGTSMGELRSLAGRWPDASPELLTRRLYALDIDPAELKRKEPAAARDLAVHCSLCADQTRCRHDLDRTPDDPAWREYCVNTATLAALKDERDAQAKAGKP